MSDTKDVLPAQEVIALDYPKAVTFPCLMRNIEGDVYLVSGPDQLCSNMHHVTTVSIVNKSREQEVGKTKQFTTRDLKKLYMLPVGHRVVLINADADDNVTTNTGDPEG